MRRKLSEVKQSWLSPEVCNKCYSAIVSETKSSRLAKNYIMAKLMHIEYIDIVKLYFEYLTLISDKPINYNYKLA